MEKPPGHLQEILPDHLLEFWSRIHTEPYECQRSFEEIPQPDQTNDLKASLKESTWQTKNNIIQNKIVPYFVGDDFYFILLHFLHFLENQNGEHMAGQVEAPYG